MAQIRSLQGYEVLDSRGNPTIEVALELDDGQTVYASVPSGASTGSKEAIELRDGDQDRYLGKGVQKAVSHIHETIFPVISELDITNQKEIDKALIALDGTENKSSLGANAMLAVSLAAARASAQIQGVPLYQLFKGQASMPVPMMNIINGGAHANNNLDIQEFMILPVRFDSFAEALRAGAEVFHNLKSLLSSDGMATTVGDEGGFAPNFQSHEEALDYIMKAIDASGYRVGDQMYIGLDVASTEFYHDNQYHLQSNQMKYDSDEFTNYLMQLSSQYPILSIEDGMDENDWQGWATLTKRLGEKTQLVGDDLFVTNPKYLEKGIEGQSANAILIKLNQIGTLTETLETIALAKHASFNTIISHRSGETEDTFIADLSVGVGAGQIKTGSLCRTDRVAKYNQLLRIERMTGLPYIGADAFGKYLS